MRRRDFNKLLAAAIATQPLSARAQQPKPFRIGYLSPRSSLTASDRAFLQGCAKSAMSKATTSRLNSASPRASSNGFRLSRRSWSGSMST